MSKKKNNFFFDNRYLFISFGATAGLMLIVYICTQVFPFGDNIERAHRSGVEYIAQPGGSIRDDNVIDTCNKYGIAMAFTGIRLFHH